MIVGTLAMLITIAMIPVSLFPHTTDKFRKWHQITFLSPKVGELGYLVSPTGVATEAILFHVNRYLHPAPRGNPPIGAHVLVIDIEGPDAVCMLNDQIVRLPRRWLRKI